MNKNITSQKSLPHEEDYLKGMFENFFKFMKYHNGQLEAEYISDAISGALSGLEYGFNRSDYLQWFIDNADLIKTVATDELMRRSSLNKSYRDGSEYKEELQKEQKEILTVNEVVETFGLPMNNVKDRKWRERNIFPSIQVQKGGSVKFRRDEVEKWINERRKK